jgi:hypothetical protein
MPAPEHEAEPIVPTTRDRMERRFLRTRGASSSSAAGPGGDPAPGAWTSEARLLQSLHRGAGSESTERPPTTRDRLKLSLQRKAATAGAQAPGGPAAARGIAAGGLQGAGGPLPHLDAIQHSFGKHDVTGVEAHQGAEADRASGALGASAYASGNQVAFRGAPSLHTAAHEAAHVVQQRAGAAPEGGIGAEGDRFEQHADRVADRVARRESAEPLLDEIAGGGRARAPSRAGVQLDRPHGGKSLAEQAGERLSALREGVERSQSILYSSIRTDWLEKEVAPLEAQYRDAKTDAELKHVLHMADLMERAFKERSRKEREGLKEIDRRYSFLEVQLRWDKEHGSGLDRHIADYAIEALPETKAQRNSNLDTIEYLTEYDYARYAHMVDTEEPLWHGRRRGARERVHWLEGRLDVLAGKIVAGETPWNSDWDEVIEAIQKELVRLGQLDRDSWSRYSEFQSLAKDLVNSLEKAVKAEPKKEDEGSFGLLDIPLAIGEWVVDQGEEIGKTYYDVYQIATSDDPQLVSQAGMAAQRQGATSGDVAKGMLMGAVKTPVRLVDAIVHRRPKEAIKEALNLYTLFEGGRSGMARLRNLARDITAGPVVKPLPAAPSGVGKTPVVPPDVPRAPLPKEPSVLKTEPVKPAGHDVTVKPAGHDVTVKPTAGEPGPAQPAKAPPAPKPAAAPKAKDTAKTKGTEQIKDVKRARVKEAFKKKQGEGGEQQPAAQQQPAQVQQPAPATPAPATPKIPGLREIEVDSAARLKSETPSQSPNGWEWYLFDERSGAYFCKVEVDVAPGQTPTHGPHLTLTPKDAFMPDDGSMVSLKSKGFSWTDEALRLSMDMFRQKWGMDPPTMGGQIAWDNLGNFQWEYAQIRAANPGLSPQAIGARAARNISFGRARIKVGYGELSAQWSRTGDVHFDEGPHKGQTVHDVPIGYVYIESLPTPKP